MTAPEIMGSGWAERIGWVLLHSLWQGALVAALFAVSRLFLRHRSANARYLAGCLSLGLLIAAAVITFLSETPETGAATDFQVPAGPVTFFAPGSDGSSGVGSESISPSILERIARALSWIAPWLTMLWLIGIVYFCFCLTRNWWWVGKLRSCENEPLEAVWIAKLDVLRERLGISRPVRLLKSALVEVPSVIGWLRPVILLPASSLTGLTPEQLETILAHELAHVRRLDYLVNAFQCVVETLMFYHPVVWWISHHVREERENCCDDLVVELCGDRVTYARALTVLETMRVESPELVFAATGGSLVNRIRRLLGARTDDRPPTFRQVSGLVLVVVGVLFIALGAWCHFAPDRYQAVARVKVDHDADSVSGTNAPPVNYSSYDPYFIQTEFEVMQSDVVLRPVIDALNFREVWGRKYAGGQPLKTSEALEFLRRQVELRPVRNTSLIEIHVYSEDPDEATQIANKLAESYQQHRLRVDLNLRESGIAALETEAKEQEQKVKAAQEEVDRLRTELNISDSDPENFAPKPVLSVELLRQLQGSLLDLRDMEVRQETVLHNLLKLPLSSLRESIQTVVEPPDSVLTTLLTELNANEEKLLAVQKEFTTNHPVYLSQKSIVDNLNRKIDDRVQGILTGLETRLEGVKAMVAEINKRVEDAKLADASLAGRSRPYYEAKKRLAELLQFQSRLNLKIASQRTELVLPRKPVVTIVDAAVTRPVSPNREGANVLIVFGLLLEWIGVRWLRRG